MTDSPEGTPAAENAAPHAVSRRRLFGAVGAGAVLAGAGAVIGRVTADENSGTDHADVVAFRGEHQAGITTPAQDRMHFVAFDVTTKSRDELITLLQTWTAMAERMTAGQEATEDGAIGDGPYAPPSDTGEALDLAPSQLTLTIGFGPSLFDDRFGLADKKPAALLDLPHFRADNLDPNRSGGDIAIQACANDPQVAVHAIRNLARVAFGTASVKWSQLGFGRTSSTSTTQATPRNLFGFKDGTANIKAEDPNALAQHVWVDPTDDQAWMAGGSFLVARRIRMLIEQWDRAVLKEQEAVIGRSKRSGAPLGGKDEFDELDLDSKMGHDFVIAEDSHVRLASAEELGGIQILRRGYNFTDGSDGFGHLDAGLFFVAYCRNPVEQFVPMQQNLSRHDALNEYIQHVGSAVFACPGGLADGQLLGRNTVRVAEHRNTGPGCDLGTKSAHGVLLVRACTIHIHRGDISDALGHRFPTVVVEMESVDTRCHGFRSSTNAVRNHARTRSHRLHRHDSEVFDRRKDVCECLLIQRKKQRIRGATNNSNGNRRRVSHRAEPILFRARPCDDSSRPGPLGCPDHPVQTLVRNEPRGTENEW